jgi:hypothetical protein
MASSCPDVRRAKAMDQGDGKISASRWGAPCSPDLAPRTVLPSSASGSSAAAAVVACTQLPSTRSMAQASNCGNSQR